MADLDRTALIRAVLEELNVAATGQPISAEDAKLVGDRIPGILAELSIREVCNVDPDAVPEELLTQLAIVVANHVAPSFGRARDVQAIRLAEEMLGDITKPRRKRLARVDRALQGAIGRARYSGRG